MRSVQVAALVVLLCGGFARAGDPLEGANFSQHFSGPEFDASALEGKVVLVEYFIFG